MVFSWIHGAQLFIRRGMHGATGNYYAYLHDFPEMSFLLHFLKPNDIFWDIGANIGSYTILASKAAGAKVFAFEPVPATHQFLRKNIVLNNVSGQVEALNLGLSDCEGQLHFTGDHDTVNHVAINNLERTIQVETDTCNNILNRTQSVPVIIKLDVEGYEFPVLKGADALLTDQRLKAIIIELNGLGNRFGFKDAEIHELISGYGFSPYAYFPFERKLSPLQWPFQTPNIIYCRDLPFVLSRLETGMTIETPGSRF